MNDHEFGLRLFSISEVKARLGIGNTFVYQEISAGHLDARKIGARTFVTAESLRQYIQALPLADIAMKLPAHYATRHPATVATNNK